MVGLNEKNKTKTKKKEQPKHFLLNGELGILSLVMKEWSMDIWRSEVEGNTHYACEVAGNEAVESPCLMSRFYITGSSHGHD